MAFEVDRPRIEAAVRELISAIGSNPNETELQRTPERVAEAYAEFFAGVGADPLAHLRDALPVGDATGELVIVRDITFRSMCEHHLLPFRGRAHIAYRPAERIVGLSALPRVVSTLAARPQVQERLGEQIADALESGLEARGVLVIIEAGHGCVSDRGVRQTDVQAVTIAARGELADPAARSEVVALVGGFGSGAPGGGAS